MSDNKKRIVSSTASVCLSTSGINANTAYAGNKLETGGEEWRAEGAAYVTWLRNMKSMAAFGEMTAYISEKRGMTYMAAYATQMVSVTVETQASVCDIIVYVLSGGMEA